MDESSIQANGRKAIGDFAPDFARYNDDLLYGEVLRNSAIDAKMRSVITLVSLIAQGADDNTLKAQLTDAKKNGVAKDEMAAILTQIAFYLGWPKVWRSFSIAKHLYFDPRPYLI